MFYVAKFVNNERVTFRIFIELVAQMRVLLCSKKPQLFPSVSVPFNL